MIVFILNSYIDLLIGSAFQHSPIGKATQGVTILQLTTSPLSWERKEKNLPAMFSLLRNSSGLSKKSENQNSALAVEDENSQAFARASSR